MCDQGLCWLCSMPESCCSCEFPDSWPICTSQASRCSSESDDDPANLKPVDSFVGVLASNATGRDYFLSNTFEDRYPDLEVDVSDTIPDPGCGSPPPGAAYTPRDGNIDDIYGDKWGSPDAIPPPDSSSPVYLRSPFQTVPGLPMAHPEDVRVDQISTLFCRSGDSGQWHVKALVNKRISVTPSANPSSPCGFPTPKFEAQEVPSMDETRGYPDERQSATGNLLGVAGDNMQDICVVTTQPFVERTNNPEKRVETDSVSTRGNLVFTSRRRPIPRGPTFLDLTASAEMKASSFCDVENNRPHNATTTKSEASEKDDVRSKIFSRKMSAVVSAQPQPRAERTLKRRGSSIDGPPESKKLRLDRPASRSSCVSGSSVESKYPATKPASLRRAESLRSEISACSDISTESLVYPSPRSSPACRASPEYPSTVPCTPMPNSVDYERSKANPMIRTLPFYCRRSENKPSIPPVPIIAPPEYITPTPVSCAEDQAIVRLKALLLRERAERERDGLRAQDEKRTAGSKAMGITEPAFPRSDSAGTSDSSDYRGKWDDESVIESQESEDSAQNIKILHGRERTIDRGNWSNAFGIPNGFRKEATEWILKELPKEPVPRENGSRRERRLGVDLYDQLTNSYETRFHAAQLFQRYFLLPDKAQFWREACKHEDPKQESWGSRDGPSWSKGVWDLAVACIALSVKLHRDCLPPLGPVFATDFLGMASHVTTYEAFELAQRDIMCSFKFLLGSSTPQDVLDELWNALPTLRKATEPIRDGWAAVQRVIWDKLFESLQESDVMQYSVTLLTAAVLIDSLNLALARHYKIEADANICKCKLLLEDSTPEPVPDDTEPTSWQVCHYEASQTVDAVTLDVKDVLELTDMELDECRRWLSYVGHE